MALYVTTERCGDGELLGVSNKKAALIVNE